MIEVARRLQVHLRHRFRHALHVGRRSTHVVVLSGAKADRTAVRFPGHNGKVLAGIRG